MAGYSCDQNSVVWKHLRLTGMLEQYAYSVRYKDSCQCEILLHCSVVEVP